MLIKKIKKKHLNTGKNYFVFQLFEEVEVQGVKKFKMVLSLGPKLNIPENEHQLLADCIESKSRKTPKISEFPSHIQALAEEFVAQLSSRESARRKRPENRPKKPLVIKKSSYSDEGSFDEDYEPKRRFNKFGNKPISQKDFSKKVPKLSFSKSNTFKRNSSSEDFSFNETEQKADFEPKRRFSKFGAKPSNRDGFKPRSQKPSYDRSSSFKKQGSFEEEGGDRSSDFEPKKRFSKFGKNPRETDKLQRNPVRRSSNKSDLYAKKTESNDFKPKKTFSKFGKGPSKNKKSFSRGPKKRFD